MKASELRSKNVDELQKELLELRKAQFGLRMQLATQSLTKNSEIQRVKREIARVHTVLTEKAKASKQGARTRRTSVASPARP